MLLTGQTALITGAAKRLGAQMARTLHQNGANLIIHYRASRGDAETLAHELNDQRPASAVALGADLVREAELGQLAADACAAFGGLDILINNASTFYPTPVGKIDAAAWDDLVGSNFRAPLFLTQACYPELKRRRGCVINLVDIYAAAPLKGFSVYCGAKAANQMLIKSLALELAPEVRVNGIAPGAILWPDEAEGETPAYQQEIISQVPLQRTGDPRAIADAALFLATSDYITGDILRVDGGRMLNF